MLSFVVAIANNNVIGKDNKLPWYLPNDLHRFKEVTTSKTRTMIMGRKTFESLPKILPGRKHIVLTQNKDYRVDNEYIKVINSIDQLRNFINASDEYFVIGGSEIFSLLFPYTTKMYLTRIEEDIEGDTFFPSYDEKQWKITNVEEGVVDENNKYRHKFLVLERL